MYLPMRGMRSTCDCRWRPNSRSTFSRSPRIGSKSRTRSAGVRWIVRFKARQSDHRTRRVSTRGRAVLAAEPDEIVGDDPGDCLALRPADLSQMLGHARDPRRLVALAPKWDRREEWAVGLGEQLSVRYHVHRITNV